MRRNIQNSIENIISEKFISGEFVDKPGKIIVKSKSDSFVFSQTIKGTSKTKSKKNTAKNTAKKSASV